MTNISGPFRALDRHQARLRSRSEGALGRVLAELALCHANARTKVPFLRTPDRRQAAGPAPPQRAERRNASIWSRTDGIGADHAELAARGQLLVPGPRGEHDHVARPRNQLYASVAAELRGHLAAIDAEGFVRIAVIVVEREYPVAPRRGPAVAGKELLEQRRRIRPGERQRRRIDEQRPARMVGDRAVGGEQVSDDLAGHGAHNTKS